MASVVKEKLLSKKQLLEARDTAREKLSPCLCGCGTLTANRFAPGHDAIHKRKLGLVMLEKPGTEEAKIAFEAYLGYGWKPSIALQLAAKGKTVAAAQPKVAAQPRTRVLTRPAATAMNGTV